MGCDSRRGIDIVSVEHFLGVDEGIVGIGIC